MILTMGVWTAFVSGYEWRQLDARLLVESRRLGRRAGPRDGFVVSDHGVAGRVLRRLRDLGRMLAGTLRLLKLRRWLLLLLLGWLGGLTWLASRLGRWLWLRLWWELRLRLRLTSTLAA